MRLDCTTPVSSPDRSTGTPAGRGPAGARGALLAALLLAAQPALALDPAECVVERQRDDLGRIPVEEMEPMEWEVGDIFLRSSDGHVTDLGGGIVVTEWLVEYATYGSQGVTFDHCASGQSFVVETHVWSETGERRLTIDPIATMQDLIASPEAVTLERASSRFVGFAGPVRSDGRQTCGCAAFYPELRGDLEPF
jgi:hypothetical protein